MTDVTLGIDIGGTNTAFGLVDRKGGCIATASIPTYGDQPVEKLFERLFSTFELQWQSLRSTHQLKGVGIGAPNGNYFSGKIMNPPNLSWKEVDLIKIIKSQWNLPVKVTNDANAAALGEMQFGRAKGMRDFIEITLGTGLGSGIVVNGQLVYGNDGNAGEMGHMLAVPNGRLCNCGRHGCLETYASAIGIRRTVEEMLQEGNVPSLLRKIDPAELTSKDIARAAEQGDPVAIKAFEFTAKILGRSLADVVAILSPEAIILFGGLAQAGDLLYTPLRRAYDKNVLNIFSGNVKIIPSGLDADQAAILGAGALIWSELEQSI